MKKTYTKSQVLFLVEISKPGRFLKKWPDGRYRLYDDKLNPILNIKESLVNKFIEIGDIYKEQDKYFISQENSLNK